MIVRDRPQILGEGGLGGATYPGPLKEEEKGPGTHCMRMHWGTSPVGTTLGLVLQVAQWYYSSGVPSLYLLVFYHCIHNSQSISAASP